MYAEVVFNISIDNSFHYEVPDHLQDTATIGKRVISSFRKSDAIGFIVSRKETLVATYTLKPLLHIIDEYSLFNENDLKLYSWLAHYYKYPLSRIIWQSIPTKASRGFAKKFKETKKIRDTSVIEIEENHELRIPPIKSIFILSSYQEKACKEIQNSLLASTFSPFLLHGVTGSGKTEVYLRSIEYVLTTSAGRSLMLVPEIALTPQLIEIVTNRFGDNVAVFHSKMTEDERYTMWMNTISGKMRVIIGVRSLILLPIPDIKLIIVDEEHETTYKQDALLLYNARDTALMKAKIYGCTVILGSATPSIESYYNAKNGKYQLLEIPERITKALPPESLIIDMKSEQKVFGEVPIISDKLEEEIQKNLDAGEKTILFLNRRGFSSLIICNKCGATKTCRFCSVSLTFHQGINTLLCHYCGYRENFTDKCSSCGKNAVVRIGLGTERIHHELNQKFPDAKLFRMDSDTTKKRGSANVFHDLFKKGQIDILIGTQMIAKGLDFPEVTLVGIMYADMALSIPDFRACERTFQLITQVAGRAGRGDRPGRVIIQTFNPTHYSIVHARNHDYHSFYNEEISYRNELGYPPYSRISNIRISGMHERKVEGAARDVSKILSQSRKDLPHGIEKISLLGPSMCPIYKLNNKYRWNILIKAKSASVLDSYLCTTNDALKNIPSKVSIRIDMDPLNFL